MSRLSGLFSALCLAFLCGQASANFIDADKYVIQQFLQSGDGFFYYEAMKCPNGPEVTLKCTEEHTVGSSESPIALPPVCDEDCTCVGTEFPDCVEVARR